MNAKYLIFLVALFLLGYSCSQTKNTASNVSSDGINYAELNITKGKAIVQTVCITCHDPKNAKNDRIAPPLEIVKQNYLSQSENEKAFIKMVSDFILNPSEESAKLHSEVDEFGLMDPLGYSKNDIQSVALYLYRTELERPDWVESENNRD